jgi:hypothetical protein
LSNLQIPGILVIHKAPKAGKIQTYRQKALYEKGIYTLKQRYSQFKLSMNNETIGVVHGTRNKQ